MKPRFKQHYRPGEISKYFKVSKVTMIDWINKGYLPAYATIGKHFRIAHKDVIAFMKKRGVEIPEEFKSPEDKYRILIVDDEKNVIEAVKLILEDIGVDIEIRTATNGVTAGLELIDFKPHLVILDVLMPGADGDVVLKAIKEKTSLKNLKVLVYTGYPKEGKKLLRLGADKLIVKSTKDDDVENFQKEVCRLLGVKYRKFAVKKVQYT